MEGSNCCSVADMAAIMNGNGANNFMNNPFFYLIWLAYMGNGGFGFGNRAGEAAAIDVNGQLNAIRQTMADNQNANALGAGIQSVADAVAGGNTGNMLGQKDLQAAIQTCCCNNQTAILNQTNQLQGRIDQLANGVQTGFANLGFLTQQQTNELNAVATANTQRILDKMCADTTQELRDKLAQASQNAQTNYLISQLKTSA